MIRGTWSLTEPLVPVNIPATMIRVGGQRGISADALLQGTGLTETQLSDPSARLTYQQMINLVHN